MAAVRALAFLFLTSAGAALRVQDGIQHNLTICNAYAENKPLSVYTVNNKAKLTEEPLKYKACKAIVLELAEDERVDFKLGGLSVGTFHVGHLPFASSNLLLVPYRKGNGTMAATFYSHTFSVGHDRSEIAIVDAYDGSDKRALKIGQAARRQTEAADLKGNTVVSVAPGAYKVSMDDSSRGAQAVALAAAEGGNHVVMRVGGDDGLPAELVVWSGEAPERSGALRAGAALLAAAAACAAPFA